MTRRFHYLGLMLATFFSLWLVWHFVIDFKLNAPSNPNYPDQFANNISVTMMDKAGRPQYQLFSPLVYLY